MDKISITNFRKVKEKWDLEFAPITFFTGTNNSGKSSVLKALLLLEDYVKSDNHFELTFNGDNYNKHKIDCYSNAINWFNAKGENKNLELIFEYEHNSNSIKLIFTPLSVEGGVFSRGKLKLFQLITKDNSSLKIKHQGGDEYIMVVDNDLLRRKDRPDSKEILDNKLLRLTIQSLIEDNVDELGWINKEMGILEKELKEVDIELDKIDINRSFKHQNNNDLLFIKEKNEELIKGKSSLESWKKIHTVLKSSRLSEAHLLNLKQDFLQNEKRKILKRSIELNQELGDSKKGLKRVSTLIHNSENFESNSDIQFMPEFSLSDFDNSDRSFDFIIRRVLSKYFKNNESELGPENHRKSISKLMNLSDQVINSLRFNIEHLSPQRNNQTRLYLNDQKSNDINKLIDVHTHNPIDKRSVAAKYIKDWMGAFDIGSDYSITPIQGLASIIEIKEQKEGGWINLVDKGFGAGQIFSIILQIGLCINSNNYWKKRLTHRSKMNYNHLIIIEEPEANLHPALQSKLAEMFLETYQEHHINFIIETHSEYVLRSSQVLVKKHFNNEKNNEKGLINNSSDHVKSEKTVRLNKVLRELNLSLDKAAEHLANSGIEIKARPTTKLSNKEHEILIEGVRRDRTKKDIKDLPFAVYYFEKNDGPYKMRYRHDGKFMDEFGTGFFDVSSNLAFDIL